MGVLSHIAYFAVIVVLATMVTPDELGSMTNLGNSVLILGFLGVWRYSWAMVNFTRAFIFRLIVHPRWRRKAIKRFEESGVRSHCYVLITSYMVPPDTTLEVYAALFRACARARDGATIVASVVDGADKRLIQQVWDNMPDDVDLSNVTLVIDRIEAAGKRDAINKTLKIIASFCPQPSDILIFADGDTQVPEEIWEESAPVFTNPKIGALTTDEGVSIPKDNLFKDWFIMRFNQRQVMMCSMGLSTRVLTLTGRMSVFRATLATNPDFMHSVHHDYIDHWRLGRVKFLTGDDKSTWYWLLRNGYKTAYLPHVRSWSAETQPRPGFLDSASTLMIRWFGNMMRTNWRAVGLGPRRVGAFAWWSILDQRVSIWTTLTGPLTVMMAVIYTGDVRIAVLYAAWVMFTRYVFCVVIALMRGTWFPVTHPFLLYFSQVAGAAVKSFVFFRLDRQKWTRQKASAGGGPDIAGRAKAMESTAHHVFALAFLTLAILLVKKL